jgi:hypothetical protein
MVSQMVVVWEAGLSRIVENANDKKPAISVGEASCPAAEDDADAFIRLFRC